MVEIDLIDLQTGKSQKKLSVSKEVFGASLRRDLLHSYVVMQGRKARQGTHSTKTRAEVSGTGKKPFRQKGTGNARQGTLIGPHQVGGGIAFGPKPRTYSSSMNKKTKQMAICSALSQKRFEERLAIYKEFEVATGKTRDAKKILSKFENDKVLMVGDFSEMTLRSLRNLKNVKVLSAFAINVRDVLLYDWVLISELALGTVVSQVVPQSKEKVA
jgi:large subunit ribosomal protein L4